MSRCYSCWVEPENTEKLKIKTIKLMQSYCGDITLYGGESEEEHATTVVKKLWEEEGRYVDFSVQMTYLEDLPYEDYNFDEDEYEEFMKENSNG